MAINQQSPSFELLQSEDSTIKRWADKLILSLRGLTHKASPGFLAQEFWINVQGGVGFNNGWGDYGVGTLSSAYFKDSTGRIYLRGALARGTLNTTSFILPDGYRPSASINFASVANSAFAMLSVTSTGYVIPVNGSNVWFSLDNISFDTR